MLDEVEVVDKVVVVGVVVRSLNTFLELMPTSQLRLPYIVPVHLSTTPVHYTGPVHRSSTPVHYTGPLYKGALAERLTSVLRKYPEGKQLHLHCHLKLYCTAVQQMYSTSVQYWCTIPMYSTSEQYQFTVLVYNTSVQY